MLNDSFHLFADYCESANRHEWAANGDVHAQSRSHFYVCLRRIGSAVTQDLGPLVDGAARAYDLDGPTRLISRLLFPVQDNELPDEVVERRSKLMNEVACEHPQLWSGPFDDLFESHDPPVPFALGLRDSIRVTLEVARRLSGERVQVVLGP